MTFKSNIYRNDNSSITLLEIEHNTTTTENENDNDNTNTTTTENTNTLENTNKIVCNFIVCMDISYSMDDIGDSDYTKLDLVKHTIKCLVSQLPWGSVFSLVIFNDKSTIVLDKVVIDGNQCIKDIGPSISKIKARGATNLCSGLMNVFNIVKESNNKYPTNVLVLSDGQVNCGIMENNRINNFMTNSLKKCEQEFDILPLFNFFGYGTQIDSELLTELSNKGPGHYYFIKDFESMATKMSECFGDMIDNVLYNVQIMSDDLDPINIGSMVTNEKKIHKLNYDTNVSDDDLMNLNIRVEGVDQEGNIIEIPVSCVIKGNNSKEVINSYTDRHKLSSVFKNCINMNKLDINNTINKEKNKYSATTPIYRCLSKAQNEINFSSGMEVPEVCREVSNSIFKLRNSNIFKNPNENLKNNIINSVNTNNISPLSDSSILSPASDKILYKPPELKRQTNFNLDNIL